MALPSHPAHNATLYVVGILDSCCLKGFMEVITVESTKKLLGNQ